MRAFGCARANRRPSTKRSAAWLNSMPPRLAITSFSKAPPRMMMQERSAGRIAGRGKRSSSVCSITAPVVVNSVTKRMTAASPAKKPPRMPKPFSISASNRRRKTRESGCATSQNNLETRNMEISRSCEAFGTPDPKHVAQGCEAVLRLQQTKPRDRCRSGGLVLKHR